MSSTFLQTNAINILAVLTACGTTFIGSKVVQAKLQQNLLQEWQREQKQKDKLVQAEHLRVLQERQDKIKELLSRLDLLELNEDERLKRFKFEESEKLRKQSDSILQKHIQSSTERVNSFLNSISDRLKASEVILCEISGDIHELEAQKREQVHLEHISRKIVADDVDALGRNYCSIDSLLKEFQSLLPIARQYASQTSSKFTLFKYFSSYWLSRLMFKDAPAKTNDPLYAIAASLERGELIMALQLYQLLRGWPRLILREWAGRCYDRLEYIEEIQSRIYLNKL